MSQTEPPQNTPIPMTLCIVNYNGATYLRGALTAALAHDREFDEILIIDNASTDDSLAIIAADFPSARVVSLDGNRGPGVARNVGFEAAGNDLILFQDNDVCLQPGCAAALHGTLLREGQALLVAPRVLFESMPSVIQYDSADCHFLGLMALRNANQPVLQAPCVSSPTSSVVTACFLIDPRRWSGGPLFDAAFIFNYEDHDFGIRTNLRGLQTWVEPNAVVQHGGGTAGLSYRPGQAVASRRMYCLIRNRWLILAKSYALRTLILLAPALVLYEAFQLAGLIKKGFVREWWQAATFVIANMRHVRRERAAVQATRRVSDVNFLRAGPLPLTGALQNGRLERIAMRLLETIANYHWKIVRPFI